MMRCLTYNDQGGLYVTRDFVDSEVPPYAILSHTWGADGDEAKIDGLQHFWVDTCCIDNRSHVELSEAITSMYRWYQRAAVCYAYLADVSHDQESTDTVTDDQSTERGWQPSFRKSRWFTRGWTLQELLAPKEVIFYSKEGKQLGTKSGLKHLLHEITDIPTAAIVGRPPSEYTVAERLRWTRGRQTKKKEDQAYCLLGIFSVFMPLNYGEGDHAFIRLTKKINKAPKVIFSLSTAVGATFDSYGQTHQGCHPATRVDLLESIRRWAREVQGKSIFWLNGMAGTGKSTISWTVAKWLADLGAKEHVALGASFFFKRGESDRSSAALLFPTIASQLAAKVHNFDVYLAQATEADPQICSKSLDEQFRRLILEPLQQLDNSTGCMTYVIVIDALDECKNENDIRTVLQLWSQVPAESAICLRLFLTSRPELVVRLGFKKMSTDTYHDLILHQVPEIVIQRDIRAFFTDVLAEIRDEYNLEIVDEQLHSNWPGYEALQALTMIATPLFIVAATIYRLIRDADHPQHCLEAILHSRDGIHLSDTGQIYRLVLSAMAESIKDKDDIQRVHLEFRIIVGSIIELAEPLSRKALAALLELTTSRIQLRLRSLHAVLEVPAHDSALIRPLHLSFSQYLVSQEIKDTPFWVDKVETNGRLWRKCLTLLSSSAGLAQDICHLRHPGQHQSTVSVAQVDKHLRSEIRYACRYWVSHFLLSDSRACDGDEIHLFLQRHLLHWLEVLSFMGRLAEAIDLLTTLQETLSTETTAGDSQYLKHREGSSSQLVELLEDARRFTLAFRQICEQTPLQLYICASLFTPQNSVVRRICSQTPTWIEQGPIPSLEWGLELQRLEGHSAGINGVAFSLNGSLLASACSDGTLRLWEVRTGRQVQRLTHAFNADYIAVAFSYDNSLIASVASDGTARLWQISTGSELQKLQTSSATAIAFSPTESLLACASRDRHVQLWKADTDQRWHESKKLVTSGQVRAVVFSPNGSMLASAGNYETVQLWETLTGQLLRNLEGTTCWFRAIAFSLDGSLLVSGADNGVIWLWESRTGRRVRKLKVSYDPVVSVVLHPRKSLLATAGDGGAIRIWNYSTGALKERMGSHDDRLNTVAISPNGSLLASIASDTTIRLWTFQPGQGMQKPQKPASIVSEVIFSPDGLLVASIDREPTMRIWSVSTGHVVHTLKAAVTTIRQMTFSPDGKLIVSCGSGRHGRSVLIWNVSTGEAMHGLRDPREDDRSTARLFWSPSSSVLGMEWEQPLGHLSIQLWDIGTGEKRQMMQAPYDQFESWTLSSDGSQIASISDRRKVRFWSAVDGELLEEFEIDHPVRFVTPNPEGDFVIESIENKSSSNSAAADKQVQTPDLKVARNWITYRGDELLWLPPEYRDGGSAVFGNTIAIGRHDGIVSIFKINYPLDHTPA